jgi:precorrin-2 dehydrogenase
VTDLSYLPNEAPVLLPIFLKLQGRRCLAVGGGRVAEPRIEALVAAGADVFVVAPKVTGNVQKWAQQKKLVWENRPFELSDLNDACFSVCATSCAATNQAVFEESQKRGVFCSVADKPELSNFYFPSMMRRGALQIAISTAGNSPDLEQRLRAELENKYGPEYAGWLEWLGKAKESIFADPLSPRRRKTLLRKLSTQRGLEDFLRRQGMTVAEENR